MLASSSRPVERPLALAPVETRQVAARRRRPYHAVLVDVTATDTEARQGHVVDFRQASFGHKTQDRRGATEHADSIPNRAVHRARHHSIGPRTGDNPLVFGRVERLIRLDVFVALAIAVGIEDEGGPTLGLRRVTGLVEPFGVDPTSHRSRATEPQRLIGIIAKLRMMRPK